MTNKVADRVEETSVTTGTGTYALAGATAGNRAFSAAFSNADDGVEYCATDGINWEVGYGTYSANTLTRDTIRGSSNAGNAVNWSANTKTIFSNIPAAVLSLLFSLGSAAYTASGAYATAAQGATADSAQRPWTFAAIDADANPTLAVNTFHLGSIAGYTADRTAPLPAVAAVGDRVGLFLTEGDSAFELLLTAAAGDTLNGVAGGTEWSRIFITNEVVIFRCVVENATWIVEYDGRIAQKAIMRLSTNATAEVAGTATQPTAKGGVWTVEHDNASITTAASDRIKTRRNAVVSVAISGYSINGIIAGQYFLLGVGKNSVAASAFGAFFRSSVLAALQPSGARHIQLVADDFLVFYYQSQEGGRGLLALAAPRLDTAFTFTEVL